MNEAGCAELRSLSTEVAGTLRKHQLVKLSLILSHLWVEMRTVSPPCCRQLG